MLLERTSCAQQLKLVCIWMCHDSTSYKNPQVHRLIRSGMPKATLIQKLGQDGGGERHQEAGSDHVGAAGGIRVAQVA